MAPERLPNLLLPRTEQRNTWSVLASVAVHAAVVALFLWVQAVAPDPRDTKRPGLPGAPGGGGGIQYITLEPPAPAAAAAAVAPQPKPPEPVVEPPIEPPVTISVPIRKLDMPLAEALATQAGVPNAAGAVGAGGAGAGGGTGGGVGRDSGVGAGGEGGDTFPPQPKYAILPPVPRPASLRGRALRVHFWVSAEGKVTRVKVEPEIRDAAYRASFVALMREYVFDPARRLDGTRVDGETTITITL